MTKIIPQKAPAIAPVIAVVIPCFRETAHVLDVINAIGKEVSQIIVVDDACPDHTGVFVKENCKDPRVKVLSHEKNTGVGGATMTGYLYAIDGGADILVKVDGDGQMDPKMIPALVQAIADGEADYTKGNRFHQFQSFSGMPAMRITGNMLLSFASKLSSGYWDIFDPTNGFTAIQTKVAALLPMDQMSKGFFFESDMLFRLGLMRAVVKDVPMQAKYGSEKSAISIPKIIPEFLFKHYLYTCKRVFHSYFVREFTFASIQLVLGKLMFLFGVGYGAYWWYDSTVTDIPATAGTVILAALPIILGSQFLIAFINYDTRNVPKSPLHPLL
ncbi:MAG: glycosyltransferase family 2 protein [Rhodospirillales bacterium]|nr:glycosyltransferase family 2 protein [Rhodospirillales bacterium]